VIGGSQISVYSNVLSGHHWLAGQGCEIALATSPNPQGSGLQALLLLLLFLPKRSSAILKKVLKCLCCTSRGMMTNFHGIHSLRWLMA
jgi:hypothetical protein